MSAQSARTDKRDRRRKGRPAMEWKPEIQLTAQEDFKPHWHMAAGALMALGKMDVVKQIGEICTPPYVFKYEVKDE